MTCNCNTHQPRPAFPVLSDDMDGGVTAALIEKGAEGLTAADFVKAEFARHPDGQIAARANDHEYPWATRDTGFRAVNLSDAEMAERGWIPVRECPDPEAHGPVDFKVLLEQAEREVTKLRAAHPAPLTPDAISDEMQKRAHDAFVNEWRKVGSSTWDAVDAALTAALTEPPTWPEGAEELAPIVDDMLTAYLRGDLNGADVPAWLASRGVRAGGGA